MVWMAIGGPGGIHQSPPPEKGKLQSSHLVADTETISSDSFQHHLLGTKWKVLQLVDVIEEVTKEDWQQIYYR